MNKRFLVIVACLTSSLFLMFVHHSQQRWHDTMLSVVYLPLSNLLLCLSRERSSELARYSIVYKRRFLGTVVMKNRSNFTVYSPVAPAVSNDKKVKKTNHHDAESLKDDSSSSWFFSHSPFFLETRFLNDHSFLTSPF